MQDRSVTLSFHPSAKCPLLRCHMACIFMPRVTLSFIHLSRNTCNSDLLGIRRNLTMYLDFARRTQRYDPRRHFRSREIPRFATRVYHFTLSGVSHFDCQNTIKKMGQLFFFFPLFVSPHTTPLSNFFSFFFFFFFALCTLLFPLLRYFSPILSSPCDTCHNGGHTCM